MHTMLHKKLFGTNDFLPGTRSTQIFNRGKEGLKKKGTQTRLS